MVRSSSGKNSNEKSGRGWIISERKSSKNHLKHEAPALATQVSVKLKSNRISIIRLIRGAKRKKPSLSRLTLVFIGL